MMYSSEINTEKIRNFLRAVYRIKKNELKRKEYKGKISTHISKIKKITLSKKFDQRSIEEEFEKLEKNINEALDKERQILEEQRHGSDLAAQLKNRLDKLEMQLQKQKEKHESLSEVKEALERIHEEIKYRKKNKSKLKNREKELEEKIKKKLL